MDPGEHTIAVSRAVPLERRAALVREVVARLEQQQEQKNAA